MKKVLNYLNKHFEEILLIWATIIMILLTFFQVVSRYVFNISLAWSEEVSRYIFIWTVWLAVPYAVIKGRHIRLTIFRDMVNHTGKFIFDMIFFLVSIAFFIYVGVESVGLTSAMIGMNQVTPAVGIPKWICYLALPVGCILGGIRFLQYAILRVQRFIKDPADSETFVIEEED